MRRGSEQHAAARRQRRQRRGSLAVGRQHDAVGGQLLAQRRRDLAFADEQQRAFAGDHQVGGEHRVVGDVGAAQVGDPGDVVERRDENAPARRPGRPRRGSVAACRGARSARTAPGARRPPPPAGPGAAARRRRAGRGRWRSAMSCAPSFLLQRARRRQRQHGAVGADHAARRQVLGEPLDVTGTGAAGDLHHLDAGRPRSAPRPASSSASRPTAPPCRRVTTSVPAEPVKPLAHSRPCQRSGRVFGEVRNRRRGRTTRPGRAHAALRAARRSRSAHPSSAGRKPCPSAVLPGEKRARSLAPSICT